MQISLCVVGSVRSTGPGVSSSVAAFSQRDARLFEPSGALRFHVTVTPLEIDQPLHDGPQASPVLADHGVSGFMERPQSRIVRFCSCLASCGLLWNVVRHHSTRPPDCLEILLS